MELAGHFAEARFAVLEEEEVRFWACRGKPLVHIRERAAPSQIRGRPCREGMVPFIAPAAFPVTNAGLAVKLPSCPRGRPHSQEIFTFTGWPQNIHLSDGA